jgi:hypothetical protein
MKVSWLHSATCRQRYSLLRKACMDSSTLLKSALVAAVALTSFDALRQASMMHLKDIDLEMTTLCRCARSVPMCKKTDADLLSRATTLLSAFDWRRQPALRNTRFFLSNWPKDGVCSPGTQLVKVASTVGPCSESDGVLNPLWAAYASRIRRGLSAGCGGSWLARPR